MQFLEMIDLAALFWFQSQHYAWLDTFMKGITFLGDQKVVYSVLLVAFLFCTLRGHFRTGLLLLLCTGLAWGAAKGVKALVARPRPDVAFAVVSTPESWSFPSSHAVLSAAVYGALTLAAAQRLAGRVSRRLVLVGGALVILLVGVSRLYLGVHFVTDVVGGWMLGGACAFLFLWLDKRLTPVSLRAGEGLRPAGPEEVVAPPATTELSHP